jgi:hypothetical protein
MTSALEPLPISLHPSLSMYKLIDVSTWTATSPRSAAEHDRRTRLSYHSMRLAVLTHCAATHLLLLSLLAISQRICITACQKPLPQRALFRLAFHRP